ncbi:MAG: RagB/SusD family nutrient uptake outer membrane protein, partial [Phocaeicola sp.]
NFMTTQEQRGDNIKNNNAGGGGGVNYAISHFTETPENNNLYNAWSGIYRSIMRVNMVLNSIDNVGLSESEETRIKGEASFLRALSYFHLVRMFGPVPLVIAPQTSEEARNNVPTPVSKVYEQIIADLKVAQNLPQKVVLGRVSKYAATTLLAKVYLYEKKWDEVVTLLEPLATEITGTKTNIELVAPNVTFPNGLKTSKDIIFAIQFLKGGVGESVHQNNRYRNQDGGNDLILPQSLFEEGDLRKALLAVPRSGQRPEKFNMPAVSNETDGDMPVLRAAEVMLMYAEALNERLPEASAPTMEALNALNAVRKNAGLTELTLDNLTTKAAFRKAVYTERRLELALECDRWFDIVRTNQFSEINPGVDESKTLYAYPQRDLEITANPSAWVR